MMFKREIWLLAAVAIFTLSFSTAAKADITATIGNVVAQQGAMVSVEVNATSDANGGEEVEGYAIPLDFGNDGEGLPPGLTFINATSGTAFGSIEFDTSFNGVFDFDGIANDETDTAGTGLTFDANDTLLFTLNFQVGLGVAPGTVFDLVVDETAAGGVLFQFAGDGGSVLDRTSNAGSIRVVAIPEPGSVAFLVGGCFGLLGLRRRRK